MLAERALPERPDPRREARAWDLVGRDFGRVARDRLFAGKPLRIHAPEGTDYELEVHWWGQSAPVGLASFHHELGSISTNDLARHVRLCVNFDGEWEYPMGDRCYARLWWIHYTPEVLKREAHVMGATDPRNFPIGNGTYRTPDNHLLTGIDQLVRIFFALR